MFGTNFDSSSFPTIGSFAEAEKFHNETKPMQRGPNKGVIPLRSNRDAATYSLHLRQDEHPITGEMTDYYAAKMYDTDIILWWRDGTISISSYSSRTTDKVQSAILPNRWDVSSWGRVKVVHLPTRVISKVFDLTLLTGRAEVLDRPMGWDTVIVPFDPVHDYMHLHFLPTERKYIAYEHGVMVGPTGKYAKKEHRALVHAVRKLCRQVIEFARDENALEELDSSGPPTGWKAGEYIDRLIERHDWSPGKPVTGEMLREMLSPVTPNAWASSDCVTLDDRLGWTQELRVGVKTLLSVKQRQYNDTPYDSYTSNYGATIDGVVTIEDAHIMCEAFEKVSGQQPDIG